MRIGQRVSCTPQSLHGHEVTKAPVKYTGKIVYVHPQNLWCIVEFETKGGKVRESFYPYELAPVKK